MSLSSLMGSSAPSGREFFDLVKAIGESKSKQEEDRIIAEEVVYLKKAIPATAVSKKKAKELIIRSLYVEMLGQDGSFAYMKIVELCASSNISFKKAGYLCASLTLHPEHEFRLMLVNRMQQDMKSTNVLESTTALSGVCKLVTEDMVPAVIGDVLKLLNHDMDAVRKKAVSALHRLYQLDKECMIDHYDKIRRVLCDKDPAVMAASLGFLLELTKEDVSQWKDLVSSLVSILKQIVEHRLSKEFDYHRIPAPWVQMNILRTLAVLGRGDQAASEEMYEVLADVMKRADTGINVGYAIVYEVVNTVTSIYPNPVLLDSAATSISRFIRSDSHNLKYIGIKGLAAIVKDHPRYAADHQIAVVDCLEDPDETLKRKTLSLLFRMTNSVNVEFIVNKLLHSLEHATDDHFRTDLVGQITQCAERYAANNAWFVRTMIKVFELAGDKITAQMAQTLIALIAEGSDDNDDDEDEDCEDGADGGISDDELRSEAVCDFLGLIGRPKLPDLLAQTMSWVLGEYGYLSQDPNKGPDSIVTALCELVANSEDSATRGCAVTAVMKLVAQMGSCPPEAQKTITAYQGSVSVDVQQRCKEFLELLMTPAVMIEVLPVDASCEDIDVDENMSFLNTYVDNALAAGAAPYSPPQKDDDDDDIQNRQQKLLNTTPYATPTTPAATLTGLALSGIAGNGSGAMGGGQNPDQNQGSSSVGGSYSSTQNVGPTLNSGASGLLSSLSSSNNKSLGGLGGLGLGGGGPWGKSMVTVSTQQLQQQQLEQLEQLQAQKMQLEAQVQTAQGNNSNNSNNSNSGTMPLEEIVDPMAALQRYENSITPTNVEEEPFQPISAPVPRELTDKEKMAQALFGGMPASSTGSSSGVRRNRGGKAAAADVGISGNGNEDLLGVGVGVGVSGADVSSSSDSSTSQGGGGGGLLDMDDLSMLGGGTPVPPVPVSGGGGTGTGVGDMFASMTLSSSSSPPPVPVPVPISPVSLVSRSSPQPMSTPSFGQNWGNCPCENKKQINPNNNKNNNSNSNSIVINDLVDLEQCITRSGAYSHVESISATNEAIFAGTDKTNKYGNGSILVHVKLLSQGQGLELTVRSGDGEVTAAEAVFLYGVLSS